MPELPEVEAVKRIIGSQIQGHTIEKITVNQPEIIACPSADTFCRRLTGQIFGSMERRGKFLIFPLDSGDRIILHLRMTGCLLLTATDAPPEAHTHLIFQLSGGKELRFSDTRRFGRFWLSEHGEADTCSGIAALGMEPFDPAFCGQYLSQNLGKRKKSIKECLMDQHVIAGIGNIYSDEILFAARIFPARPACGLTGEEWERLSAAIPERLSYFIEKNEMTPEEYLQGKGQDYRNTPFLQAYGREGTPCPVCKEPLRRMVIGGRSSTYCPVCQAANADDLYRLLLASYGKPRWWSDDPYTVMFQAVLVQNTTWSTVEKACAALGGRLSPALIQALPPEELEEWIRPCGFCKAKARTIKDLTAWFLKYHFDSRLVRQIPGRDLRKELLSIRGIGKETADVILVYAFHKPSFIIDAYTRRFLARLGYDLPDDTAVRHFFESALPRDAQIYGWYHWLILDHCITVCRKTPKCDACPLKPYCRQRL